jgi:hypothetical protein
MRSPVHAPCAAPAASATEALIRAQPMPIRLFIRHCADSTVSQNVCYSLLGEVSKGSTVTPWPAGVTAAHHGVTGVT